MKKSIVIKPQAAPNGEINVTPLVDVVLVLLIIFMVVTPLLEKDIRVQLPTTEKVEEITPVMPDQLVVRVAPDGQMALNGVNIESSAYVPTLKERLASRADKTVFVMADDSANYGKLVIALDGAKAAGALALGMATDAPSVSP